MWNRLAVKNAEHHVYSNTDGVTPDGFKESGKREYKEIVKNDPLIVKSGVALDLGCGVGRMTEFFLEDFSEVYGIDISKNMVDKAKERVSNVKFLETDGQSIPLKNDSLDFVLSHAVFHHMPSLEIIEKNLSEIWRCLRNKGIAKIQFRGTPVKTTEWFYGFSFTPNMLKKILQKHKFKLLRLDIIERAGGKQQLMAVIQKNNEK